MLAKQTWSGRFSPTWTWKHGGDVAGQGRCANNGEYGRRQRRWIKRYRASRVDPM